MENLPLGVHFGHLVTGATVGVGDLHTALWSANGVQENTVPNLKSALRFISLIF